MKNIYIVLLLCCMNIAAFAQVTFNFTGTVQTYVVPSGVTSISVDMQGGTGGNGYSDGIGGAGGRVQATLPITAGTTIYVYVAGAGRNYTFTCCSVSGGGAMAGGAGGYYYGGGGGASDIRIGGTALTNRMIVAGGGGGGGYDCSSEFGGSGGGLTGGNGIYCSSYDSLFAGAGGTQTAGGACAADTSITTGLFVAVGTGSLGSGGSSLSIYCGNGAGGGGYYGGGAGYSGSGGGGSSYADVSATGVIHTQGYNTSGNGAVIISATSACPGIISGPSSVCAGSAITLTDAVSGGTWSGSNSRATIDASGIVTGVTAGIDTIYYSGTGSCGAFTSSVIITVPGVGTISGPDTVVVGSTATLSESVVGGIWSSSSTGVATISSTGVVTGVSAGTDTISYSLPLCGTMVTTAVITVLPSPDIISGHILFGSGAYTGVVKVWLITFDTGTLMLEAIDSTVVYCGGSGVYYYFTLSPTDSFRIKAAIPDTGGVTTGYVPTYHDSSFYWHDAGVFWHTSGTADTGKNIYMAYGAVTTGPGFIAGNVLAGADKGTSGGTPVVGLRIFLVNSSTGSVMQHTRTNGIGYYSFSGLPLGLTYTIFPDSLNYLTTPIIGINLTTGSDTMTTAGFKQHTLSKAITPLPTGINNLQTGGAAIVLFPNPTSTKLNIGWQVSISEKVLISIRDITGREVFGTSLIFTEGEGITAIELPLLPNGLYLVNVKSPGINYNSKLQVSE